MIWITVIYRTYPVERHHIFGSSNRKNSEKYGFVIPLRPDLHPNGAQRGANAKEIDLKIKNYGAGIF